LEGRVAGFEGHFETIYRRLDALDQKVSRYFVWLIGIQMSVLLAVVAALVGG
jgi:hypothetical protein